MDSKVQLIVDKDLGHILAVVSVTDAQRSAKLTLAELVAQEGLLLRNSPHGGLRLPVDQLDVPQDMPSVLNVDPGTVIQRPRTHIYDKKGGTVIAPNKDLILDKTATNIEEVVVELKTPTPEAISSKIMAKAYAQSQDSSGPPQILSAGEVDVRVEGSKKKAYIPLNFEPNTKYDVLVLVQGFSALLYESLLPNPKVTPPTP